LTRLKSFSNEGMHRFFLGAADGEQSVLTLEGREAHHALHALRVRSGEPVVVLNGTGTSLNCEVTEVGRDRLELKVVEHVSVPPLPYEITLAQAIPKGKLFEEIIEKATELGAHRIVPLLTQRTIPKWDAEEQANKLSRWKLVAIDAIKQCGSAWLPIIEAPMSVAQFAAFQSRVELPLVGSLAGGAQHPRTGFDGYHHEHRRKPRSLSVAIGPEGDFTPEELGVLQAAGARPITLGRLVLRTDTAAIYCLSVINHELQSRD
jgi:16S rRNA (uracil1498-N3)-methyltransferase